MEFKVKIVEGHGSICRDTCRTFVNTVMNLSFSVKYRVIHNSRTLFIKSVHLKGGKVCKTRPTDGKRNSPSFLFLLLLLLLLLLFQNS